MQPSARKTWKQNPDAVRGDILRVAISVFSESGLKGGRIEEIVALTKTSKRMIYYYFGDKEGLYRAALEAAYGRIREAESQLDLAGVEPVMALARLVRFTFDHHRENTDLVRLVMIENVHRAAHLSDSEVIRSVNAGAISDLENLVKRGIAAGAFRADLDAMMLHWQISAQCFFNVSNRPTFSALYGDALFRDPEQERLREEVVRTILGYARA
ncbi:TetR/AcrR family transcriptional regulator [Primorskyibacter sp. 2E107]|uniref:TetR/AcrR family transcriptional regulator n=1 Tax=Primorskyibacter sp. 2E107 TaxID=3403458 RepID=UPI003AF94C04